MKRKTNYISLLVYVLLFLTSCAYNPLIRDNRTTGSPIGAVAGASVGAGSVALLGGSKPLIALAGLGGGALGYYLTTLRHDAAFIIQAGGEVYKVGDFVGIYIPTDKLFEPNTALFLPQAQPILDSIVAVLKRYPNSNILVSGNTSGFSKSSWDQKLSEKRAKMVTVYLWNAGINQFKERSTDTRKLSYVGYGDYFPISNTFTNEGIRENSRIQITVYPTNCDLQLDKRHIAVLNMGAVNNDDAINDAVPKKCWSEDGC